MHEIADIACNFTSDRFDNDLDEVIDRAIANHITKFGLICSRLRDIDKLLEIYNRYSKNMFFTIGVHPHHANEINAEYLEKLKDVINKNNPHAIGETGLDFYYNHSEKKDQIYSFEEHISASQEKNLPLIVHTRSAEKETLQILEKHSKKKETKILIHCFTGTREFAFKLLDLGAYISASGVVTFKKSQDLANTFRDIPNEKILVETDAPYLAPVPLRGKPNEPSYIIHTVKFLSKIKNLSFDEFSKVTTNNFFNLFGKLN